MAELDVRPGMVTLFGYGGDTLTFSVTAPESVVNGMEWNAEVRTTRSSTTVSATFAITPPAVAGGPAILVLSAADTARLTGTGTVMRITGKDGTTRIVQKFTGEWDCQVRPPGGGDPVRTLVQGILTLESDVTRPL